MPTIADLKNSEEGWQPLLLVAITLQGTNTPLLLSTLPLDGVSGVSFPGIGSMPAGNYLGRLAHQDVESIQWRSELGIDRIPKMGIHIMDADGWVYNNVCIPYGFRGASMIAGLVMHRVGTSDFSSDCKIKFRGVCDMELPVEGMTAITVTANSGHNTAVVQLPIFPHQRRCSLYFPRNADERAEANKPNSTWCPYAPDQSGGVGNTGPANHVNSFGEQVTDASGYFIMCDYIRSNSTDATSGCMARLGNAGGTTVAPDGDINHDQAGRHTGAFTGLQWSPGTYYAIAQNFASKSSIPTFSFLNSSILGQFANLVYGEQMVAAKIANVIESGNDTKCEAVVCSGDIGSSASLVVIVNGIQLNRNPSGDNNLWWDLLSTGSRFGNLNTDTGYRNKTFVALGDPYGSMATIRTVFYKDIFTGFGTPTINVITPGPALWVWAPIESASGNGSQVTVTFPTGDINPWIGGAGTVMVFDCSLSGANGVFTAVSAAYGPPGTVTYTAAVSGSGTGGYIGYLSNLANDSPPFVLLDILKKCRWDLSEINLRTFYETALICREPIEYVTQSGDTSTHARYKCKFALSDRRSAAEIIAAVLRGFDGYLWYDDDGLLCLGTAQTLADQQPTAIPGSNDSTGYSSIHADGTAGTGYVAHSFDESNILRVSGEGEDVRFDIEWVENATVLTPNQLYATFQDEDNQYSVDSINDVDIEAMVRAGGALQPGGSLVTESLTVLGPPNFDQMSRIMNRFLAEMQYGNEDNVPKGTRTCVIGVTCEVEHLRGGHLVHLSLVKASMVNQLFRVLKVQVATNYEVAKVTLRWENEIWRTDAYGQQPQAFHSNAATNRPARVPLPWQPDAETPDSTIWGTTERFFQITEIDTTQGNGDILVQAQVSGKQTVNQIKALCQPPLVPLQASVSSTGGTVATGHYMIQLCAKDADGNLSAPSKITVAVVGDGITTGTITLDNLVWGPSTSGYEVFVGSDNFNITFQSAASGTPSSIDITDIPNVLRYGPPDLCADSQEIIAKFVVHAGIIGSMVADLSTGPNTVTIGSPATGTLGDVSGRKLMLLGRQNLEAEPLPIVDFTITSNTDSVLTVDRDPTTLLQVGDVVVISMQPTSVDSTTGAITDSGLVNAFAPTGVDPLTDKGKLIRIISGTGRYQVRTVDTVTESTVGNGYDTYTPTRNWDVMPDSTSIFILEDPEFRYNSSLTQINSGDYAVSTIGSLNITNIKNQCMLVQVITTDPGGTLVSNAYRSPFRLIWLFGTQGTRTITADVTQLRTDGTILADARLDNIVIQALSYLDVPNHVLRVRKIDGSANTVTLRAAADELWSDGSTDIVLTSQGDNTTVVFDGN